MRINVLTVFPEMFESFLGTSIIKRAISYKLLNVELINFRDYSSSKSKKVDDTPYGGGAGMVLQVEPIHKCLQQIEDQGLVIALTPTGELLNDKLVDKLVKHDVITLICGHYEGFDERVYNYVDMKLSIGDYILTGGETAAFVVIDSLTRKIDGVINKESIENDSFSKRILDYPVYTKPVEYDGFNVPDVLLSGNHQLIEKYRNIEALKKTYFNRRDLLSEDELIEIEEILSKSQPN